MKRTYIEIDQEQPLEGEGGSQSPEKGSKKINSLGEVAQQNSNSSMNGRKKRKMEEAEEVFIRFSSGSALNTGLEGQRSSSNGSPQKSKFSKEPSQANRRDLATPWLTKKTREIKDSLLRFHNQIIDFYNYVTPTHEEHSRKNEIFLELRSIILKSLPSATVSTFGSFNTKLYLPDGDIDVAILISPSEQSSNYGDESQHFNRSIYDKIHKIILNHPHLYNQVQYIRKSKVPLIKLQHIQTSIQFDISVNKQDGIDQLEHIERMNANYPEYKYLLILFKCTLKLRNLGETYSGGIGSFLLFCMIFVFLREIHNQQKLYTLSQMALRFMEYYGIRNDWESKTVYVQDGRVMSRRGGNGYFSFMSPQDSSHDIGKSAFKIRDAFGVFKNRYRMIIGMNFRIGESIVKELVNPNVETFMYLKR